MSGASGLGLAAALLASLAMIACGDGEPEVEAPAIDEPTARPAPTEQVTPATRSSPTVTAAPTRQASPKTTTGPAPRAAADSTSATATSFPAAEPSQTPGASPLTEMGLEEAFPNLPSFHRMVGLEYPDDGTENLFLVLQPGRIAVFVNDRSVASADTFLDIRERVNNEGNEEGLLGLAFDPEYRTNGYFYVYYSAAVPRRSVLARYTRGDTVNRADPESELIILEVAQPYVNHNGGRLTFGPDGYLYLALGDGGDRGDPAANGQNPGTLLGSIIRIDVGPLDSTGTYAIPADNPFVGREDARNEVWAYGLRNPWRFSFDRDTGDLWAADVGQNRFEEVDLILPGRNYGWNVMEGLHCFVPRDCDPGGGLELPVFVYDELDGCSVTGGYVYRGARIRSLYGAYVYGDFCDGHIWALRRDETGVVENMLLAESDLQIPSFGEDRSGELYILSFEGRIYRLTTQ